MVNFSNVCALLLLVGVCLAKNRLYEGSDNIQMIYGANSAYPSFYYGQPNRNRRSGRRQVSIVKQPSIVINPNDGESYFVNPGIGQDALVYFPKRRSMTRRLPPTPPTHIGVDPQIQEMIDAIENMIQSPKLTKNEEAMMAVELVANHNRAEDLSPEDAELISLLLAKSAAETAPDGPPQYPITDSDKKLTLALIDKLAQLRASSGDHTKAIQLAEFLIDKYQNKEEKMDAIWRKPGGRRNLDVDFDFDDYPFNEDDYNYMYY